MARCLLAEGKLPTFLWAEMINTAAYIRNRCPTNLNFNKTPEELWSGKKPIVQHLKIIGSKVFALNKRPGLGKFDTKSDEYVLVGYCDDAKAYRIWKRGSREIKKSRDVKFIESNVNEKDLENIEILNEEKFYEYAQESLLIQSNNFETLESQNGNNVKDKDDSPEIMKLKNKEIVSLADEQKEKVTDMTFQVNQINELDPITFEEAMTSENAIEWRTAMQEEYEAIQNNNTWELVERTHEMNVIGCKWVFKSKRNSDGDIVRYRARLVAKGCSQRYGIDYNETFSPVVRTSTLRLLFAIAAEKDLQIHHMDVSTAFLHGDLNEQIYMVQPKGFIMKENENKVCKLKKSLYGLKQAGRQWHIKFSTKLLSLGYKMSRYDNCLYTKIIEDEFSLIATYVDDLVMITNKNSSAECLLEQLNKEFKIKYLGEPKLCVGFELRRNEENKTIAVSQEQYIKSLIKKYKIVNAKKVYTPMEANYKLEVEPNITGEAKSVDKLEYQELIGGLNYIAICSRPDIAYAVSALAQFCQNPRRQHWNAALRILNYLKTTSDAELVFSKTSKSIFGYSDSSWAEDINNRKSHSGYVFIYGGSAVYWESKKQRVVATSSAEAEYIGLSNAAKEATYIKFILQEMNLSEGPIEVFTDSQAAQHIANYEGRASKLKHIHYRYHYIREAIQNNTVSLTYVPTEYMAADNLTKALPKKKHFYCAENYGMNFKLN